MRKKEFPREYGSNNAESNSRKIIENTSVLTAASVATKVFSSLVAILMARYLSTEIFGAYETAFALTFSLVSFSEFGTSTIITKFGAIDKNKIEDYLGSALVYKLFLSLVIFPGAVLASVLFGYSQLILQLVMILVFFTAASSFINTFNSVFQARQRMSGIAVADLAGNFVFMAAAVIILVTLKSIRLVAFSRVAGGIATLVILIYFIRSLKLTKLRLNTRFLKKLLKGGLPFGLATLVSAWRLRIDIMLLSGISSEAEAGIFAASYRLLNFLLVFTISFSYALTPAAFASGSLSNKELADTCRRSTFAGLVFSVPAAFGIFFFGRIIVEMLFGTEYVPVQFPLEILTWFLPFLLIWSVAMNGLWGAKKEYLVPVFLLAGLIVNIFMDLWLIPLHGAYGAAIGALSALLVSTLLSVIYIRIKLFSLHLVRVLLAPLGSSIIMILALYGMEYLFETNYVTLFIKIIAGIIIYLAGLWIFLKLNLIPYPDYGIKIFNRFKNKLARII